MRVFAALVIALLLPCAAQAQTADCPTASNAAAAVRAGGPDQATLALGQAASVTLHPVAHVTFVMAPERAPKDFGGLLTVMISEAGTYQVGLSGAWIDVLKDAKAIASSAHGHGAGCFRKLVSLH